MGRRQIELRACGTGSLKLPVLGIGCWSFGGGDYWGDQSQQEVDSVVGAALDAGCSYFDTAEVYNDGRSEESLGLALGRRRHEAIIGSKVSPDHTRPSDLRASCDASLRRIGTDYIDVYMIHWPINPVSLKHYTGKIESPDLMPNTEHAFETLVELKKEGKIRHIGVSNFGPTQLSDIEGHDIAVNQVCYNLLSRAIEFEILPICSERNIGVLGYMPLLQGILTGKFASIEEIPRQRTRTRHFSGYREGSRHGEKGYEALVECALAAIETVAVESGVSMLDLALAWSVAGKGVTCTITGVRNVAQLDRSIQAATTALGKEILLSLDNATEELKQAMGASPDVFEAAAESRIF